MGTDAILKYKGEEIVNLGRAYNFENIGKEGIVSKNIDNEIDQLMRRLVFLVGYTPASWEEGQGICKDIEITLDEFAETLTGIGRFELLQIINENDDILIENE
jgi:hypothetical protein